MHYTEFVKAEDARVVDMPAFFQIMLLKHVDMFSYSSLQFKSKYCRHLRQNVPKYCPIQYMPATFSLRDGNAVYESDTRRSVAS
ncbi:hypothetical protein T03_10022 [Trichinella britovi]|uniref:Uncharacterized protein n=1 Tax=Trichinella britovi TaxID=45882 RepID=A0A0V1DHT4_TRIBR|nr:hypothetical protein T03_10022 [Trichinella britovi]